MGRQALWTDDETEKFLDMVKNSFTPSDIVTSGRFSSKTKAQITSKFQSLKRKMSENGESIGAIQSLKRASRVSASLNGPRGLTASPASASSGNESVHVIDRGLHFVEYAVDYYTQRSYALVLVKLQCQDDPSSPIKRVAVNFDEDTIYIRYHMPPMRAFDKALEELEALQEVEDYKITGYTLLKSMRRVWEYRIQL